MWLTQGDLWLLQIKSGLANEYLLLFSMPCASVVLVAMAVLLTGNRSMYAVVDDGIAPRTQAALSHMPLRVTLLELCMQHFRSCCVFLTGNASRPFS